MNLLERDDTVCPDDVVNFNCTAFNTTLLGWYITGTNSATQISCSGDSRLCLGGGDDEGIHAVITSVSSGPVHDGIRSITSTLIIHNITAITSVDCVSQSTISRRYIQVLGRLYL